VLVPLVLLLLLALISEYSISTPVLLLALRTEAC
jgi:hypothetical protein